MASFGKTVILIGATLVVIGILLTLSPILKDESASPPEIPFLGKLPGDIRIEKENFTFYFPVATCLVASAILSLIFWFFQRR